MEHTKADKRKITSAVGLYIDFNIYAAIKYFHLSLFILNIFFLQNSKKNILSYFCASVSDLS